MVVGKVTDAVVSREAWRDGGGWREGGGVQQQGLDIHYYS